MTASVAPTPAAEQPLRGLASPFPPELDLTVVSRNPTALAPATREQVQSAPVYARTDWDASRPLRASVIVVTHNNLAFTKLCLHSLLANTPAPRFELIVVDNASTDGTQKYLREVAALNSDVHVILNNDNRGFPAANNQALAVAKGDVLVLLNNDTIVSAGWLTRLIEHADKPDVGSVCACTNRIGNEAEIDTSYRTLGDLEEFAARRAREHAGEIFDIPMAPMFCLAIRREVFEKLGPLDEQFGTGMFEDDDYAMRVRAAGLRVCCADDIFVHHFGGASFSNLVASGEHGKLFVANRERFEAKWKTTWQGHGGRRKPDYDDTIGAVRAAVTGAIPKGSTIAVINKGDLELLKLEGMRAWHFPRLPDGQYAGHYPADSVAAIEHLEELRRLGAEFLLIPRPAMWWIHHYPQFAEHLAEKYRLIETGRDCCAIYDLREHAQAATEQKAEHWQDRHLRELTEAILPAGASVAWSPRKVQELVVSEYVVVPARSRSLIEQYPAVLRHLNERGRVIADRANVGVVWSLLNRGNA